jgi:tRNA1(Val) A37 N6-methylase TrmN6
MTETAHLDGVEIKSVGAHYTPPELADFLAERALVHLTECGSRAVRVLDPACGNGGLLHAIAECAPPSLRERLQLVGYETDPVAIVQARKRLESLSVDSVAIIARDFLDAAEPHYQSSQSPGLFGGSDGPRSDVDLVISNPPYVRTQVLGARRSKELAKRFDLTGRVDLYHAFVIGMWSVLGEHGVLSLLTSNRFMSIQSGAVMRKLLRTEFDLREVYDLGDTKLFGAAVLPAVVIAKKRVGNRATLDGAAFARIYEVRGSNGKAPRLYASPIDALRDRHSGIIVADKRQYELTQGQLGANGNPLEPWVLESVHSRGWLATVERSRVARFGDVAEVRVGLKTTADNVFIRRDWDDFAPGERPEQELIRPLITHHGATRWRLPFQSKSAVLYPHETNSQGRKIAVNLSRYPRAEKYLNSHRQQLEGRKYVLDAGRAWFEIWVPQQPADWEKPKIVYPDISEFPTFFLDNDGAIVNGDCYWMTLLPNYDEQWLYLMLAVANSRFIEKFYDTVFHNKLYSGRRRFMTQYVKQFPLPAIDTPIAREAIEIVRKLVKGSIGEDEVARLQDQVDALVWSAFGVEAIGYSASASRKKSFGR